MSTGPTNSAPLVANKEGLQHIAEGPPNDKVLTAVKNLSALFPSKDKLVNIKPPASGGQGQAFAATTCDGGRKEGGAGGSDGGVNGEGNMFERARNLFKCVSLSNNNNTPAALVESSSGHHLPLPQSSTRLSSGEKAIATVTSCKVNSTSSPNTIVLLDDDDSDADVVITSTLPDKATASPSQHIVLSENSTSKPRVKVTARKTGPSSAWNPPPVSSNSAIVGRPHDATSANSHQYRHSRSPGNNSASTATPRTAGTAALTDLRGPTSVSSSFQQSHNNHVGLNPRGTGSLSVKVAIKPSKKRRSLPAGGARANSAATAQVDDVITIDDSCLSSLSDAEDSPQKNTSMSALSPVDPLGGNTISSGLRQLVNKPPRRRKPPLRIMTALIDSVFSSLHQVDLTSREEEEEKEEKGVGMRGHDRPAASMPAQAAVPLSRGSKQPVISSVTVFPKRPHLFDLALAPAALGTSDTDTADSVGDLKPEVKALAESVQQRQANDCRSVWADVSQALSQQQDGGVGSRLPSVSSDTDNQGGPDVLTRHGSGSGDCGASQAATQNRDTLVKNFIDWSRQKLSGITVLIPGAAGNSSTSSNLSENVAKSSFSNSTVPQVGTDDKVDGAQTTVNATSNNSTVTPSKRTSEGNGSAYTGPSQPKNMRMAWVKPNNASICGDSQSQSSENVPTVNSLETTVHDTEQVTSTSVGKINTQHSQAEASATCTSTAASSPIRDNGWWLDYVPTAVSSAPTASSQPVVGRQTTKQPLVASVAATTKRMEQRAVTSSRELSTTSSSSIAETLSSITQNGAVSESVKSEQFLEERRTEVRMLSNSLKEIQDKLEHALGSHSSDRTATGSIDAGAAYEPTCRSTSTEEIHATKNTDTADNECSKTKMTTTVDDVIMIESSQESTESSESDSDSSDSESSSDLDSSSSSGEEASNSDVELVMVEAAKNIMSDVALSDSIGVESASDSGITGMRDVECNTTLSGSKTNPVRPKRGVVVSNKVAVVNETAVGKESTVVSKTMTASKPSAVVQCAEIAKDSLTLSEPTTGKEVSSVTVASKVKLVDDSTVSVSVPERDTPLLESAAEDPPTLPSLSSSDVSKGASDKPVENSMKVPSAPRTVTPEALSAFTPTSALNKSYLMSLLNELTERKESLSEDAYWEPRLMSSPSRPHFASEAATTTSADRLATNSSSLVSNEWQRGFVAHKLNACRMPHSLIRIPQKVATSRIVPEKDTAPVVDDSGKLPTLELRSSTLRRQPVMKSRAMTKARTVASEVGRQNLAHAHVAAQTLHSTETTFDKAPTKVLASTSVAGGEVKKPIKPLSELRKMLTTKQLPPPPPAVLVSNAETLSKGLTDDTYTIENVSDSSHSNNSHPSLKIKISRSRSSIATGDSCSPVPGSSSSTPNEPSSWSKLCRDSKKDDDVFTSTLPNMPSKPADVIENKCQQLADTAEIFDDFVVDFDDSTSAGGGVEAKQSSNRKEPSNKIAMSNINQKHSSEIATTSCKNKTPNKDSPNQNQVDRANQKPILANQKQSDKSATNEKNKRSKSRTGERLLRQLQSSEGFLMDKVKASRTGSITDSSSREQRKLQQTLMQFSLQEIENQMRREKQSKVKSEYVAKVEPDIINLEEPSMSRSSDSLTVANAEFNKRSAAAPVKQSKSAKQLELKLEPNVTVAPGVKRLRTKAFHKDLVYEQAVAEQQIKTRLKRRQTFRGGRANLYHLQQQRELRPAVDIDVDYTNSGEAYSFASSPASTASSSHGTTSTAIAPYSFWKRDRRRGGGGFKPKGPIKSIEARRRAANFEEIGNEQFTEEETADFGLAPSVEIDIDEPALPSFALPKILALPMGMVPSVALSQGALAGVDQLDIVKREFIAQQQLRAGKLTKRAPSHISDTRSITSKVNVEPVQLRENQLAFHAPVSEIGLEPTHTAGSRRNMAAGNMAGASSEHTDSIVSSVVRGADSANIIGIKREDDGSNIAGSSGADRAASLKIRKKAARRVSRAAAASKATGGNNGNGSKLVLNRQTGETALHKAARLGREDLVQRLCEDGDIGVNAVDFAGYTALHESAAANRVRVAKVLIAHGANINVASFNDGVRPLHDAIEHDHVEMVRLLLSAGADWTVTTFSGSSVLDLARSSTMQTLLRDYSTDVVGVDDVNKEAVWQLNRYSARDLLQLPEECDNVEEEEFVFEMFSQEPLPVYTLTTDSNTRRGKYMLLLDVLDRLGLSANEFVGVWDGDIESIPRSDFQRQVGRALIDKSHDQGGARGGCVDVVPYSDLLATLTGVEDTIRISSILPVENGSQPRPQCWSAPLKLQPLKRKRSLASVSRVVIKKPRSSDVVGSINTNSSDQQVCDYRVTNFGANNNASASTKCLVNFSSSSDISPSRTAVVSAAARTAPAKSSASELLNARQKLETTLKDFVSAPGDKIKEAMAAHVSIHSLTPTKALVPPTVCATKTKHILASELWKTKFAEDVNRMYRLGSAKNSQKTNVNSVPTSSPSKVSSARWFTHTSQHPLSTGVNTSPAVGTGAVGSLRFASGSKTVSAAGASTTQSDVVGGIISAMNQGQVLKVISPRHRVVVASRATVATSNATSLILPTTPNRRIVNSRGRIGEPISFVATSAVVSSGQHLATKGAMIATLPRMQQTLQTTTASVTLASTSGPSRFTICYSTPSALTVVSSAVGSISAASSLCTPVLSTVVAAPIGNNFVTQGLSNSTTHTLTPAAAAAAAVLANQPLPFSSAAARGSMTTRLPISPLSQFNAAAAGTFRSFPSLSPNQAANLPVRAAQLRTEVIAPMRLAAPPGTNVRAAMNLTRREQQLLANAMSSSVSSAVRIRVVYDAAGIDIAPASNDYVVSNSIASQLVSATSDSDNTAQADNSSNDMLPQ